MDEQEERREQVALALILKDGHQPEDIGDWRKSVYAKKADEFIKEHSEDGLCLKCQGTGFTEQEHGLFRVVCDCEKGQALRMEVMGESGIVPLEEEEDKSSLATMVIPESENMVAVWEYSAETGYYRMVDPKEESANEPTKEEIEIEGPPLMSLEQLKALHREDYVLGDEVEDDSDSGFAQVTRTVHYFDSTPDEVTTEKWPQREVADDNSDSGTGQPDNQKPKTRRSKKRKRAGL